jgi:hypothetical protein
MHLSIDQIVQQTYPSVVDDCARALFCNPDRKLPKGIYFLAFKEKDGPMTTHLG